jgi:hypothetical protein
VGPWIEARTSIALYTVLNDTVKQVLLHRQVFWLTAGLAWPGPWSTGACARRPPGGDA